MGSLDGSQIYENFHGAAGTASLGDAQAGAYALSGHYDEHAMSSQKIIEALREGWTGAAADAATQGLAPLAGDALSTAEALDTAQDLVYRQINSFHAAANAVQKMPAQPTFTNVIESGALGQEPSSMYAQTSQYNAVAQANVDAYQRYVGESQYNAANLPPMSGTLPTDTPHITVATPPQPAPGGGPPVGPKPPGSPNGAPGPGGSAGPGGPRAPGGPGATGGPETQGGPARQGGPGGSGPTRAGGGQPESVDVSVTPPGSTAPAGAPGNVAAGNGALGNGAGGSGAGGASGSGGSSGDGVGAGGPSAPGADGGGSDGNWPGTGEPGGGMLTGGGRLSGGPAGGSGSAGAGGLPDEGGGSLNRGGLPDEGGGSLNRGGLPDGGGRDGLPGDGAGAGEPVGGGAVSPYGGVAGNGGAFRRPGGAGRGGGPAAEETAAREAGGPVPAGRGAPRTEDAEHRRKLRYEVDGEELFGIADRVAPAVIGETPAQYRARLADEDERNRR